MTPKEKAEELVSRIYEVHSHSASDITYYFAKKCALISVNEIIKALRKDLTEIGLGKGYWYNVIKEIEKL